MQVRSQERPCVHPASMPKLTSGNHFTSVRLIIEERSQPRRRSIYGTGGSMVVKTEIRSPPSDLHLTRRQRIHSISVEISDLFTRLCGQAVSLLIFAVRQSLYQSLPVEQSLSVSSSRDIYPV